MSYRTVPVKLIPPGLILDHYEIGTTGITVHAHGASATNTCPRLKTPEGRTLYALRKHTPEPVFGIIKSVMGFRQFMLRGLDGACGEWRLFTVAWNVERIFNMRAA